MSALAAAGALAPSVAARPARGEAGLKTVLRGGRCFLWNHWRTHDVGIDAVGKLRFGPAGTLAAPEVIDVSGKVVAPGFIDILADNARNPQRTYAVFEQYKLTDGVTTSLQMHGGSADTADWYATMGVRRHHVNYGASTFVMTIRRRAKTLAERKRQVEKCLDEGALGVSHSIEYMPTPYDEVLEYARLAAKYDRPLFLHLRHSSSDNELAGVDEALSWARDSGARLHIDHLHSTGGTFHMAEALDKIRAAIGQGLKITCCVYPYSYWATYLGSNRFSGDWRKRYGISYNDLRLVGTGERLTEESFAKYKALYKLVAVPEGAMPMEKTVDLALREDFCMVGSDGGIESSAHANSHPRGAGCFATAIRHCLDIGIPLEKALEKVTTLPAQLVSPAMRYRGVLTDGVWADLAVFDPEKIKARATVENPNQYSDGIDMVFVNGKLAYRDGALKETGGVAIRYS